MILSGTKSKKKGKSLRTVSHFFPNHFSSYSTNEEHRRRSSLLLKLQVPLNLGGGKRGNPRRTEPCQPESFHSMIYVRVTDFVFDICLYIYICPPYALSEYVQVVYSIPCDVGSRRSIMPPPPFGGQDVRRKVIAAVCCWDITRYHVS